MHLVGFIVRIIRKCVTLLIDLSGLLRRNIFHAIFLIQPENKNSESIQTSNQKI